MWGRTLPVWVVGMLGRRRAQSPRHLSVDRICPFFFALRHLSRTFLAGGHGWGRWLQNCRRLGENNLVEERGCSGWCRDGGERRDGEPRQRSRHSHLRGDGHHHHRRRRRHHHHHRCRLQERRGRKDASGVEAGRRDGSRGRGSGRGYPWLQEHTLRGENVGGGGDERCRRWLLCASKVVPFCAHPTFRHLLSYILHPDPVRSVRPVNHATPIEPLTGL